MAKAKYAAVAVAWSSKGPYPKYAVGIDEETTYNRITMLAILSGINLLTYPCEVIVYTENRFLVNTVHNNSLENWKRAEWVRPQGKPLKNKELWKELAEQMEKHKITFVYTKENKYLNELKKEMEEYEDV